MTRPLHILIAVAACVATASAALLSPRAQTAALTAGKPMAVQPPVFTNTITLEGIRYAGQQAFFRMSNGWLQVSGNLKSWTNTAIFLSAATTNSVRLAIH